MYTDRPIPTAYHDQSRARWPSTRASSMSPARARRPARTECTKAGMPAGGNSRATVAAFRYVSTRPTRRTARGPGTDETFNADSGGGYVDERDSGRVATEVLGDQSVDGAVV